MHIVSVSRVNLAKNRVLLRNRQENIFGGTIYFSVDGT